MKVFDADLARGGTAATAMLLTLRAMLSAANFLYRIEYDPNPASDHAALAVWLRARVAPLVPRLEQHAGRRAVRAAKDGSLCNRQRSKRNARPPAGGRQGNRAFIQSFAGHGSTSVSSHPQRHASGFHDLHGELSDAMAQEGYLWFQKFVEQDRPLSDWFTAISIP